MSNGNGGNGNGNSIHVEHLSPLDELPLSDLAAAVDAITKGTITHHLVAQLFTEQCRGRLLYDHSAGAWHEWTGTYWRKDEKAAALEAVRQFNHAISTGNKSKVLQEAQSVRFARGVETFARGSEFAVTAAEWDPDLMLLGTPGGTVDLRTGELGRALPEQRITKQTLVAPADEPACPRWIDFLMEANDGDEETVLFLQRWCGYSLTGLTTEHSLIFLHGPGGNGKSVFVNVISRLMNTYAAHAPMETFVGGSDNRHPTEVAFLNGPRLVVASETERGRSWNEQRINSVTGGEPITARYMHGNFFTFLPRFKLTAVGNHAPRLKSVDDAAARRFKIVPFICKPKNIDRQLWENLVRDEGPEILRWAINGCREWLENGLQPSKRVVRATSTYFAGQDAQRRWLEERCETGHFSESIAVLHQDYCNWMRLEEDEADALPKNVFSDMLADRGFERYRTKAERVFRGLRLKPKPKI